MKRALLFTAFCLVGCAHTPARDAEIEQAKKCAAIEIYPDGMSPARDYRVIGPVGVTLDNIPSHRERMLQASACQLGADAVIELHDFIVQPVTSPDGVVVAETHVDSSGLAVAWLPPATK